MITTKSTVDVLFGQPISITETGNGADVNDALVALVHERCESDPWKLITAVGAKRTANRLQTSEHPAMATLRQQVCDAVTAITRTHVTGATDINLAPWDLQMWGHINPAGAYNQLHNHVHDACQWSGVYYPDADFLGDSNEGALVFEDWSALPAVAAAGGPLTRRTMRIMPETGMLIVFPSHLYHRVETHSRSEVRISIAFNAKSASLTIPKISPHEPPNWRWQAFPRTMRTLQTMQRAFAK